MTAIPLDIIYEDDFLLAVNKAALTHSVMQKDQVEKDKVENSVAFALSSYLKASDSISQRAGEHGLAHRLDFETSGVIVAAKDQKTWALMRDLFRKDAVSKEYLLLLEGDFPETKTVEGYLGNKHRRGIKTHFSPTPKKRFQPSKSVFHRVSFTKDVSLVKALILEGGRRHQLRADVAFLDFPLIGDRLYGSKKNLPENKDNIHAMSPPFLLHASKLSFTHPRLGMKLCLEAPLSSWAMGMLKSLGLLIR